MVQVHTKINVIDNSGALVVRCIRLLRGSRQNQATVGNYIVGTVQKVSSVKLIKRNKQKKLLNRGDICKCIIVAVNNNIYRTGGFYAKAMLNSVVVVGDNFLPMGSRITGPVFYELRKFKQMKILAMAFFVV